MKFGSLPIVEQSLSNVSWLCTSNGQQEGAKWNFQPNGKPSLLFTSGMFSVRKTFTITNEWLLITYMYWWNWIYSDYHYAAETPKLTTSSDISNRRINHTHWNLYHSISQCCSCGYDAPLTKPGHYIYDSVALFSKPCPLNIHIWRPLSRGVE